MDSFATYSVQAARTTRASDEARYRSQWSEAQLKSGIVQAAMEGLAMMLDPEFPASIYESAADVLSFSRFTMYRDCRIHVIGTSTGPSLPAKLLLEASDKAREAITLCVLPSPDLELISLRTPSSLDLKTGAFPLYRSDIDVLASGEATLEQLLEYKLFRRLLAERPDSETQFIDRIFQEYGCGKTPHRHVLSDLDHAIEARGETESEWLEHPYLSQVDAQLVRRRHSLLFGYSSSGKSVLAFQAGRRRVAAGWRVGYLNLSDDVSWPAGLIQDLLFASPGEHSTLARHGIPQQLLIVDDLQSRPALACLLLATASLAHRVRDRGRPVLLGVSWKEFAGDAAEFCPEVAPVPIHAQMVRERIVEKYSAKFDRAVVDSIAEEAGDDIYLLRLALEVTARQKSAATREDVAEDVWHQKVPEDGRPLMPEAARRVALLTGAIGQFDIHVPPDFILQTARVEARVLSQLMESRLLRRVGDRVTLGHRSLCALVAWWLAKNGAWRELAEVGGPSDITSAVFAYLTASGSTAMIDALRALVARAGFRNREDLSHRAAVIMDVWRAFDAVVERVERQQAADPTWNSTPSSAVFVTTLFGEIEKPELAIPSLDFLRSHWRVNAGRIDIDTVGLSTVVDFDIIRQRMLDEDSTTPPPSYKESETALEIDIDRFHKTWLAGLILGAEAAAEIPRLPRDQLAAMVEYEQIRATGAFYPHRVPWCTARVVLGLAACGRNIETSPTVRRAVDWLLRDRKNGGACTDGIWRAGSGNWNTPVETTALVLLALVRAGLDPSDPRLVEGRRYLLSERNNWVGLEGAVAIEALLFSGSKWEDLAVDTARLSQRALDQSLWLRATLPANEILQQTCSVAQAATHLIEIGWTAIRTDLRALLDALDLPAGLVPATPTARKSDKTLGAPRENARPAGSDELADLVASLADLRLSRFSVVGSYLRFAERARNDLRNRYTAIRRGLEVKSTNRENYLIWAPPGSGKTSFVSEIACAMGVDFAKSRFMNLNLSELPREELSSRLDSIAGRVDQSVLCMIDEIDSRSSESWPYESIFSCLDWNTQADRHVVFVLAGSGGKGLNGMISAIRARSRGADMVDRIPEASRFEIPAAHDEDRLIIFAKQTMLAASARREPLQEIERLVLYYVLNSETLSSPRQLTEFAKAAVGRMDSGDGRLLYDHLFRSGDRQRMEFWSKNAERATQLQGSFVWVSE